MLLWLENEQGMRVGFSRWGASWLSCKIPMPDGSLREVLCSTDDPERQSPAAIGSVLGRFAGRIPDARLVLDEEVFLLDANAPPDHKDGGAEGFAHQRWSVLSHEARAIVFALNAPDHASGYPGNFTVQLRYELSDDGRVTATFSAKCDQKSIANLCNHVYFNLNGENTPASSQKLKLAAEHYTPNRGDGTPCTERQSVAETPWDFRELRPLGAETYAHYFALKAHAPAALLESEAGDLRLSLFTDRAALYLDSGQNLSAENDRHGNPYPAAAGLVLMPCADPNALHDDPEQVLIAPNAPYQRETCYYFEVLRTDDQARDSV